MWRTADNLVWLEWRGQLMPESSKKWAWELGRGHILKTYVMRLDFVWKNFKPGNGPFGSEYWSVGGLHLRNTKVTGIYKRRLCPAETDVQQGVLVFLLGKSQVSKDPGHVVRWRVCMCVCVWVLRFLILDWVLPSSVLWEIVYFVYDSLFIGTDFFTEISYYMLNICHFSKDILCFWHGFLL